MAKLKSADATGGNADIAAARAIQPDIDKTYAGYWGSLKALADVCSWHIASFAERWVSVALGGAKRTSRIALLKRIGALHGVTVPETCIDNGPSFSYDIGVNQSRSREGRRPGDSGWRSECGACG
jgi:hypothetical protein